MSRKRTRRMTPERLKRHQDGIRKLNEAFGYSGPGPSRRRSTDWRRDLLGLLGFDTKARDER
jgi:hypothetical protein